MHIDGYNFLPYLTGQESRGPRPCFFYFSDDGDLLALRYDNWKLVFAEQRCEGTLRALGSSHLSTCGFPKLFNLRIDPFERADITSNTYYDWVFDHGFIFVPAQAVVGDFLATFKDYPPTAEGGELHHRSGDGKADNAARRLTITAPPSAGAMPAEGGGFFARRAIGAHTSRAPNGCQRPMHRPRWPVSAHCQPQHVNCGSVRVGPYR